MSTRVIPTSQSFLPSIHKTRARSANLWSIEDIRRLRELAAQGVPLRSIAATLRRSESAIRNKAGMHGISIQTNETNSAA